MFNTVTPDATSEGSPRMMIIIFLVSIWLSPDMFWKEIPGEQRSQQKLEYSSDNIVMYWYKKNVDTQVWWWLLKLVDKSTVRASTIQQVQASISDEKLDKRSSSDAPAFLAHLNACLF